MREKLIYLLRTKKWNPYCLRHSAITYDSDYLPEYAVRKKARWSMNSRQGSLYIKSRMGGDLKRAILTRNGIALENDELWPKPAARQCPRCNLVNTLENKYCSKCSYPLTAQAYDEVKMTLICRAYPLPAALHNSQPPAVHQVQATICKMVQLIITWALKNRDCSICNLDKPWQIWPRLQMALLNNKYNRHGLHTLP